MKNILSYYYNVHPDNISHKQDDYYFNYNNNYYVFQMLKRPSSDVEFLYELNKKMIEKNILVHEIILNTENNKITYINNKPFVLMIFHGCNSKSEFLSLPHFPHRLDVPLQKWLSVV